MGLQMTDAINNSNPRSRLAKILPTSGSLFLASKHGDRVAHTFQPEFLKHLAIEYTRFGATSIALDARDPASDYLKDLASPFSPYFEIVDQSGKVDRRVNTFMAAILDEVPVTIPLGGYPYQANISIDINLSDAVVATAAALRKLLLGTEYKLQVDLDLSRTRAALLILDRELRSPAARLAASQISSVFDSYRSFDVATLTCISIDSAERVELFERLLDDSVYRELSEQGYYLGFVGRWRQALDGLQRFLERVVSPRRQALATVAAMPLSLATGGGIAAEDVAGLLPAHQDTYYPPIASFEQARLGAEAQFMRAETPKTPFSGQVVPMGPRFQNKEALVEAARKALGARLETFYTDDEQ